MAIKAVWMFMLESTPEVTCNSLTLLIQNHFIQLKISGTSAQDLKYTSQVIVRCTKASRAATRCQREYSTVSQMTLNSLRRSIFCLLGIFLFFFFFFCDRNLHSPVFCFRSNIGSVFTIVLGGFFLQFSQFLLFKEEFLIRYSTY